MQGTRIYIFCCKNKFNYFYYLHAYFLILNLCSMNEFYLYTFMSIGLNNRFVICIVISGDKMYMIMNSIIVMEMMMMVMMMMMLTGDEMAKGQDFEE